MLRSIHKVPIPIRYLHSNHKLPIGKPCLTCRKDGIFEPNETLKVNNCPECGKQMCTKCGYRKRWFWGCNCPRPPSGGGFSSDPIFGFGPSLMEPGKFKVGIKLGGWVY